MARASIPTIIPSATSGTQLAALLNARELAENSGHRDATGRPNYATEGMIYATGGGGVTPLKLWLAVGPGPTQASDVDLSVLFADRPGTIRYTAEVRLPAGWLWCDGSQVARVTYPALFDAICPPFTGTVLAGSATITAVTFTPAEDPTKLGLVGARIEGTGVSGLTVTAVGVNTLTLSAAAAASATATPLRLFPHGAGNGSTTFNLPNGKGRTMIGRSNMGDGVDSGLITVAGAGFDGTKLGAAGGGQVIGLTIPNLPDHNHPVSLSGSATTSDAPEHTHPVTGGGTTSSAGNHTHEAYARVSPSATNIIGMDLTAGVADFIAGRIAAAGAHTHTVTGGTIGNAGAHSHVVTLTLGATSSNTPGAVGAPIVNVQPSIIENCVIKT